MSLNKYVNEGTFQERMAVLRKDYEERNLREKAFKEKVEDGNPEAETNSPPPPNDYLREIYSKISVTPPEPPVADQSAYYLPAEIPPNALPAAAIGVPGEDVWPAQEKWADEMRKAIAKKKVVLKNDAVKQRKSTKPPQPPQRLEGYRHVGYDDMENSWPVYPTPPMSSAAPAPAPATPALRYRQCPNCTTFVEGQDGLDHGYFCTQCKATFTMKSEG
jgi:hypothetical protein